MVGVLVVGWVLGDLAPMEGLYRQPRGVVTHSLAPQGAAGPSQVGQSEPRTKLHHFPSQLSESVSEPAAVSTDSSCSASSSSSSRQLASNRTAAAATEQLTGCSRASIISLWGSHLQRTTF